MISVFERPNAVHVPVRVAAVSVSIWYDNTFRTVEISLSSSPRSADRQVLRNIVVSRGCHTLKRLH